MQESQETNKPKRSVKEIIDAMVREYRELRCIKENISALKDEAKAAGHPASILAQVAEAVEKENIEALEDKSKIILEIIRES